jgi:putative ABC transport system ATP-binding protein
VTARIEVRGATKSYRIGDSEVTALAGVDLDVTDASFVVILGPSGSGKTTLLNLIGGLDTPSSGTVRVDGTDLTSMSRRERAAFRRRSVSFVFQTFNLLPGLTALENVTFGAEIAGREDADDIADTALTAVDLARRRHHFPHQLSGGEQQRVAIARALATGNPVLLADEPTGELDVGTGAGILGLLAEQVHQGRCVLVVTHNREIARMADRVVELAGGRIVHDGPPPEGRVPISELRW